MKLKDTVVWITGASSGIGEALAIEAAARGARLILSSRREAELERVNQLCGGGHRIVPLDLADPDVAGVVDSVVAAGCPDIVVHNGGVSQRAFARDTDIDVVKRLFTINTFGAIALTQRLLPVFRQRGRGHFVVISSMVGKFGTPLRSTYAASKHALHGYFDSMRAEEYDAGIRVSMVCPGFVRTNVSLNAVTGDGSAHAEVDNAQKSAMSAEVFARRMWDAVEREQEEIVIAGGKERFAATLKRFAPGMLNRLLRKLPVT